MHLHVATAANSQSEVATVPMKHQDEHEGDKIDS